METVKATFIIVIIPSYYSFLLYVVRTIPRDNVVWMRPEWRVFLHQRHQADGRALKSARTVTHVTLAKNYR